jgi:HK97 family phage portal protein
MGAFRVNKSTSLIERTVNALTQFKKATSLRFPGRGGTTATGNLVQWQILNDFTSGEAVNYSNEIGDVGGASLVIAAVNWLGRVLPEAHLNVIEMDDEGMEIPIPDHPAAELWRRPNEFYSCTTMCKAYAHSWIVTGNPYFLKIREKSGVVRELWYIPPAMIRPVWPDDGSEFISGYEYKVDGRTQVFPAEDVIHFRDGIDPCNPRLGLSPVASVMRELYTDQQVATYSALLMKNGAVPPVVISLRDSVNAIGFDSKKVREGYLKQTQGDERGKAWVTGAAVRIDKVGFAPADLNLAQLRRLPEERLSAVIGIPAIVLGYGAGLDKATYSNARQAAEFATESYLVPLYRYIEEELTHQLLRDFDETGSLQFRFDLTQVRALSEDQDAQYARLTAAYNGGWLKRSEVREMAGYEWDEGDEVYVSRAVESADEEIVEEVPVAPDAAVVPESEAGDESQDAVSPEPEPSAAKVLRLKAKDKPLADDVLDDAVEWLLSIGEPEAAGMIRAVPKK